MRPVRVICATFDEKVIASLKRTEDQYMLAWYSQIHDVT